MNLINFGSFTQPRAKFYNKENLETDTINVLSCVAVNSSISTREIQKEVGVSKTRASKILRTNKYKPYKIHINQFLYPADLQKRLQFSQWYIECINEDPNFYNNIIWTDEAHISNDGIFNRHNTHRWSNENPHATIATRSQGKFGFNVWCCLKSNTLFYFIFEGNLTAVRYLEILETQLQEFLENMPLEQRRFVLLQQDGAPSHNAFIIRNFLNEKFPNKWIGTFGPIKWPPRSPDLSPLDYFLWGHLKHKIYKNNNNTMAELRNNVENAFNHIRPFQISNALSSLSKRCHSCITQNGGHFEHLR